MSSASSRRRGRVFRAAALAAVMACAGLSAAPLRAQMATADRLQSPGWWPTKGTPPREDYVGPAACARCHRAQAGTQAESAMARTARRAGDSDVLRGFERMAFRAGAYSYELVREGERTVYTVTDGARSLSAPLAWAFGMGKVGQTYFFERDGVLHESRISYYDSIRALDFTPARALPAPRDLEEAMGRPLAEAEVRRCFGCHNTASTSGSKLSLETLVPGVTCEACHGPGRAHVEDTMRGRLAEGKAAVFDPRKFDPADSVDFCGACHATFWDVKLADEQGLAALRSQPHRLQSSRCWGEGDARITCTACHDPHQPLVRDAAAYTPRCLACHGSSAASSDRRPGRSCPVSTEGCTECHMPKYEVPGMHFRFTDHLIRVVESKEVADPARASPAEAPGAAGSRGRPRH